MKKPTLRVLFGESFFIFWNIFVALTEEEHAVVWDTSVPPNIIFDNPNASILNADFDHREVLEIGESKTFFFLHNGGPDANISFVVCPCKMAEIQWILKFTPDTETGNVFNETFPYETLSTGTSPEHQIFIGKAHRGTYRLQIESTSGIRFFYSVYITLAPDATRLLSSYNKELITFKKNLTENSLYLKWPAWTSFKSGVKYTVVLSDSKFVNSGCEVELYNVGYEYVTTRNTSYIMNQQAKLGKTYYVCIYVMNRNSFLLPYLRGSVTFPKRKPTGLKDGVRIKGMLTPYKDTLTYRYKVKNPTPTRSNQIYWYVIACNGIVYVEINHKKDAIIKKQLVSKYKIFRIRRPKKGNRYVMKITDPEGNRNRHFEVMATMEPDQFSLPNVENFTVTSFEDKSYDVPNRSKHLIAWNAATDDEPIEYCVYYIMKRPAEERDESFGDINQCSMRRYVKRIKEQRRETSCYVEKPKESSLLQRYLVDLDSTRDYVVFVCARKPEKRRIWYNSVHIKGAGSY